MPLRMKQREAETTAGQIKTRATPAFAELKPLRQAPQQTEATVPGNYWPAGIDYSSIDIPQGPPLEDASDRLEILELLDD